ncbi:MAG: mechanosensitive ion channel [Myxococcales bacterium]|nr:mechanosensitive ion channel [Myxococcales bacterium]
MLETLRQELIRIWPTAALFIGVVIGGLIASAIARRVVRWAVDRSGLDGLAEKAGASRLLYAIGVRKGVAHLIGQIVWIAGLLVTAAAAADVLGLEAVSNGAAVVIAFLPRLLAAGLVLMGGAGLAGILRRVAVGFGRRRGDVENPELLGSLAYYGVMTIAAVVAADQAGIETELIETLLVTFASIVAAAIALAFALGSRHSFHNVVAGHFMRRLARPGDTIRVGEVEGTVIRYFGVSVILRTADGEVAVPCKCLLDNNIGLSRLGAKARAELERDGGE